MSRKILKGQFYKNSDTNFLETINNINGNGGVWPT